MEIYNERVKDLLNPNSGADLDVREDARKGTIVAGAVEVAVASLQEIMDVLGHLGFEYQIEDKIYPRNITQRGRIRVKLFEPGTKEPVVADITSRMELLKRIGAEIPNLKSRKEGKSGVPKTDAPTSSAAQMAVAAQMAARDQQMAAMAAQAAAEQAAGGAGGSSKKGKGKKKGK